MTEQNITQLITVISTLSGVLITALFSFLIALFNKNKEKSEKINSVILNKSEELYQLLSKYYMDIVNSSNSLDFNSVDLFVQNENIVASGFLNAKMLVEIYFPFLVNSKEFPFNELSDSFDCYMKLLTSYKFLLSEHHKHCDVCDENIIKENIINDTKALHDSINNLGTNLFKFLSNFGNIVSKKVGII
jgi:hypothetical protein